MGSFIVFIAIAILAVLNLGCQTAASNNAAVSNSANSKANVSSVNNNSGTIANTAAPESTSPVGSLATPSDAYRTAYEFRKNKDTAGLKKIMSKDVIEFLTMMGEEEKPRKSLDDMIAEMFERPQADKAEVRNEKINGDRATVEYLTETGDWKIMDFEKVDGKWLMGFPKADKPASEDKDK